MKSISILIILLILIPTVLCKPYYSYSFTKDFKLSLVYNIEAIIDEPYTVIIDYTSLINMTIHKMKLSLWAIKNLSHTLLQEVVLAKDANISSGWSIRRSVTITTPNDATELLIELFINYSVEVQRIYNYEVTAVIRKHSYDELAKSIKDLMLEVNNLTTRLDQMENELAQIRVNHSKLIGNYNELKRAYEYLKKKYDDLLIKYENKTVELERIKESYVELIKDHNRLVKEHDDLRMKYNETREACLSFKSKYEELSKRYEELLKRSETLIQRYTLLSNIIVALSIALLLILVYVNRERLATLLKRIKRPFIS